MYGIWSDSAEAVIASGFATANEAHDHLDELVARGEDPEDVWVVVVES